MLFLGVSFGIALFVVFVVRFWVNQVQVLKVFLVSILVWLLTFKTGILHVFVSSIHQLALFLAQRVKIVLHRYSLRVNLNRHILSFTHHF